MEDSLTQRNINTLNENLKILESKFSLMINAMKVNENKIATLEGRVETLTKHLQMLVAGSYGTGPTQK